MRVRNAAVQLAHLILVVGGQPLPPLRAPLGDLGMQRILGGDDLDRAAGCTRRRTGAARGQPRDMRRRKHGGRTLSDRRGRLCAAARAARGACGFLEDSRRCSVIRLADSSDELELAPAHLETLGAADRLELVHR